MVDARSSSWVVSELSSLGTDWTMLDPPIRITLNPDPRGFRVSMALMMSSLRLRQQGDRKRILGDISVRESSPKNADIHKATSLVPQFEAGLHDLDPKLIVEIAHPKHLRPETFAGRQGINPNVCAHPLEVGSKCWALTDFLLVLPGKVFQIGLELGKLGL